MTLTSNTIRNQSEALIFLTECLLAQTQRIIFASKPRIGEAARHIAVLSAVRPLLDKEALSLAVGVVKTKRFMEDADVMKGSVDVKRKTRITQEAERIRTGFGNADEAIAGLAEFFLASAEDEADKSKPSLSRINILRGIAITAVSWTENAENLKQRSSELRSQLSADDPAPR